MKPYSGKDLPRQYEQLQIYGEHKGAEFGSESSISVHADGKKSFAVDSDDCVLTISSSWLPCLNNSLGDPELPVI